MSTSNIIVIATVVPIIVVTVIVAFIATIAVLSLVFLWIQSTKQDIVTVRFSTKHTPGTLAQALKVFHVCRMHDWIVALKSILFSLSVYRTMVSTFFMSILTGVKVI